MLCNAMRRWAAGVEVAWGEGLYTPGRLGGALPLQRPAKLAAGLTKSSRGWGQGR